jgi:hypothetical protein
MRVYGALAAANAAPFTPGGDAATAPGEQQQGQGHRWQDELLAVAAELDPDTGSPLCGAVNPLFAAGRCLFSVDWASAVTWLDRASGTGGWVRWVRLCVGGMRKFVWTVGMGAC